MGMYDYVKCEYPLPVVGANELQYQTKDTPCQWMDLYVIKDNGTLWHEEYDTEDHSEAAQWKTGHPGEPVPEELNGLRSFAGCMTRVNKRLVREDLTGVIRFGNWDKDRGMIEWCVLFENGQLKDLQQLTKGQTQCNSN